MPQCSDHDHVGTGDVTRAMMMSHSSCDTDTTPKTTNFPQTINKSSANSRQDVFINYARTISEINFHQKKILCVNLVYDHDDEEVGLPLRTTPCSMWKSESKIYISACKTCWYILFLHPPVMKFASKSHSPLCSELPRSPPAPLSSGSRQFMTVK